MVENKKDRSNSCGRLISQLEWLTWEQLKTHFDVQIGFDSKGCLCYLWDNIRLNNVRIKQC
jgi:hypothetical protein